MGTLLIRRDTKQGFKSAARVTMLDTLDRLKAWVEVLNEAEGWNKYGVEA